MSKSQACSLPSDQSERERALDTGRSVLVQAPAGSGKTDLLTRRFLRLLSEVDEPGRVVAITFTNAAAAEMRHRIMGELEEAADRRRIAESEFPRGPKLSQKSGPLDGVAEAPRLQDGKSRDSFFLDGAASDTYSVEELADRALMHSEARGWRLLELPAQLRVRTIDSFCRELALQQPLLSGFGSGLQIAEQPDALYRRAARETLRKVDETASALGAAVEKLLLWRDNGWQEMEKLLVEMLKNRDRWMHEFVLEKEPDWNGLRSRLERPFAKAVRGALAELSELLDPVPGARAEALELARIACEQCGGLRHRELAELADFPEVMHAKGDELEEARQAYACLAELLLTNDGGFRRQVDKRLGFPADRKHEKSRIMELIGALAAVPGLETALSFIRSVPRARYSEEEWEIVRCCFMLLRHAAGELRIAFAEAGRVDYIEVAQIAQRVLRGEEGLPSDAALVVSDGIRHLLIDEFQDTSRRQHRLLTSLIGAWPEREGRTCFVVGDPMQSIYFFREADAELFSRVKTAGLEVAQDEPLLFDFVSLKENFRSTPGLVRRLNHDFAKVFEPNGDGGVTFSPAQAFLDERPDTVPPLTLHLTFAPQSERGGLANQNAGKDDTRATQAAEIVEVIRGYETSIHRARVQGESFRVAVLGRTKAHLAPIAVALREAAIPFRSVELEELASSPEVLDALALARALFNPEDRVAWLGVLRAPWCGLTLKDLYALTGASELLARPLPELLAERLSLLSEEGRKGATRVLGAVTAASALRAERPTATLGTWLEETWVRLGGPACVDPAAQANLDLLWSCLDQLPGGEPDLLGPALAAALEKLTAQPDPDASGECGVQLMTIHKSKGLEFEVVIVPELQAATRHGKREMLSWFERGLAEPNESGEITEFLIAPLQRKGNDRGGAKAWVDRVYRERERQEERRILYVAATRAREQLHFFARPVWKEKNGVPTLVEPAESLLRTAWPAFEDEIRARFDQWKSDRKDTDEGEIAAIAASAESNLLVMPSPVRPAMLRRLPAGGSFSEPGSRPAAFSFDRREQEIAGTAGASLFPRHEGGLLSRVLGTAVHTLLEELARLRSELEWDAARSALLGFEARVAAEIRSAGVDQRGAAQIAARSMEIALGASRDPVGSWIFSPHAGAASEASWGGIVDGILRTVRVDRLFKAGHLPGTSGEDCWWVIDYKTAHSEDADPDKALLQLHAVFAPQVEAYAQLLRSLHGAETLIIAGLYYPRMARLDWWQL